MVTGCKASFNKLPDQKAKLSAYVWRTFKDNLPEVLDEHYWSYCGQSAEENQKRGPVPLCLDCARAQGLLW